MYSVIRDKFELIVEENDLLNETIMIRAKPLTPEEAIGNPESEDFPILKGDERLMQAEFRGSFGQAFTDMHGNFEGTLRDVLDMELTNNFRRAIFIASLNAVMRNLGMIEGSVHCKDSGPEECGEDLVEFLGKYGRSRIALVGCHNRLPHIFYKQQEFKTHRPLDTVYRVALKVCKRQNTGTALHLYISI